MLESQGLVPTMQSYVDRMKQTDTLAIHLTTHGTIARMGVDFETTVFTILQEAISNIKKHANARNAWIDFSWRPRKFVVTVKDDGKGFDLGAVERDYEKRGSFGLLNMRERAELQGGTFEIVPKPGQGTKIILTFPLTGNEQMSEAQVPVATV
jgi:signal transduction histidine kinase